MTRVKTRLLILMKRWLSEATLALARSRDEIRGLIGGLGAAWRHHWPEARRRALAKAHAAAEWARDAIRVSVIKRRAKAAQVWAIEHDTVPTETVARARERYLDRQHRHEAHEIDRQHRDQEHAKFREKREEEERQTYSVFFE